MNETLRKVIGQQAFDATQCRRCWDTPLTRGVVRVSRLLIQRGDDMYLATYECQLCREPYFVCFTGLSLILPQRVRHDVLELSASALDAARQECLPRAASSSVEHLTPVPEPHHTGKPGESI